MKAVYNGYDEHYFNGKELKKFFDNCFLMTKHKKTCVLNMSIVEYLNFMNIEDNKLYRVFDSGAYCRLSDGETDDEIAFFGYIPKDCFNQYEPYVPNSKTCKNCGAPMKIRISKYGEFLGCSNYPNCKYKKTLYIIGREKVII